MLQYLLNATAIWLTSLVVFDIFLKKESYHGYNRFYLLFTFLLGSFLPLWQLQDDNAVFSTSLKQPMEQLIAVKQNIVSTANLPATSTNRESYIGYAYVLGAIVALLLLINELVKITRLYQTGKKSREGSCIIIETGKNYSPFSLFNLVFVSSRDNYNKEEWNILIAHEQMHGLLFHFADVLLMQLARIVFWFHPLVYIYQKRLMMQHEYQADRVSTTQPKFYGKFLIEQALLQTAPSISHSFNRSPIKNRIVMLTRKSSLAAKGKMFVFMPLILVCIVCFSKNSFSKKFEKNGNVVTYRGNKFELSKPFFDSITLIDPVTAKEIGKVVKHDPIPEKMNGTQIYRTNELTTPPQPYAENGSITDYLFRQLSKDLNRLPDGTYRIDINNIVLDQKGKIVYYEGIGLCHTDNTKAISMKELITPKIDNILHDMPALKPGKVNSNAVIVMSDISFMAYEIEVKNHKTTIKQIWK